MDTPMNGWEIALMLLSSFTFVGLIWLVFRLLHRVEQLLKQNESLKNRIKSYEDTIFRQRYNIRKEQ